MPVISLYRDLLALPPRALWPAFSRSCYPKHRPYFDGLVETYGPDAFGPGGLRQAVENAGPAVLQSVRTLVAGGFEPETLVEELLQGCLPLLPGEPPRVYLATLFFLAPAATINVAGEPAITIGLERFVDGDLPPSPPGFPGRFYYRPQEMEEMVPHEACHAARMRVLGLPPTPRRLSLKEMVFLEGTALVFTDRLVGRETLRTFLPDDVFRWHEEHQSEVLRTTLADFDQTGMEVFSRYFSPRSRVSGYYAGFCLCRDYLRRYGDDSLSELVVMPSDQVMERLGR